MVHYLFRVRIMMGLFNIAKVLFDALAWLVPIFIIILSVWFVALVIKGYKSFIEGVMQITTSKFGILLFLICICLGIWAWLEIKKVMGVI